MFLATFVDSKVVRLCAKYGERLPNNAKRPNRPRGNFLPMIPKFNNPGEFQHVRQAALLYEDKECGFRAKEIFDRVKGQIQSGTDFLLSPWRFDCFSEGIWPDAKVGPSKGADVVLLSAHGNRSLPATVSSWVEAWLGQMSGWHPILVVLLDKKAEGSREARKFLAPLEHLCQTTGAELFLYFGDPSVFEPGRVPSIFESPIKTEIPLPAPKMRPLAQERMPSRHWGLNE